MPGCNGEPDTRGVYFLQKYFQTSKELTRAANVIARIVKTILFKHNVRIFKNFNSYPLTIRKNTSTHTIASTYQYEKD